ncbi:MAG: DUF4252 domain-containing protein [Lewinella sp.]|jgi:hypothetical protein|uniref:DUF4252 domain-containing protein n=1 Tax=Lewinella sp. TaxID=2004506 RepID=UPI003D6C2168
MKPLMMLIALSLSTFILSAQNNVINSFIEKYKGLEDVTHVNISGGLLDFISKATDEDGERTFLSKLNHLRVLSVPNRSDIAASDLTALRQSIQANNYEELIRIRDGKDLVYIYLHENKDEVIEELIVLVEDPEEVTLVSLSGLMYYQDLQKLELDGEAGEALNRLPSKEEPRP